MEAAAASLSEIDWKDPKRYLWIAGLIVPTIPLIAWATVELTGFGIFYWFGPMLVFGVIPFLDAVIGKDDANPPDDVIKMLENDRYYRICTYLFIPLQYGSLIFACALWASGDLSILENIGLALSVAMVSGIAINTAHELGHKRKSLERWLSKVALAQSFYGHFFIEHNRGHHVRVATPEDPASSRFGETFWEFLPRTAVGSLTSSLHLERERLDRLGRSFFSLQNDVLNAWAMSVALLVGLIAVFGLEIAPYLLIQGLVGASLLELVNYLEHYGLMRQRRPDGRYERCRPEHSWNSNNVATNVFLYHLQRHSDHHANPLRRYQALRHFTGLPELPSGYATMMALAMVPSAWRRVMDHRVLEHYRGDITLVNIQPRKRDRILAAYGAPAQPVTPTPGSPRLTADPATGSDADAYRCPGCEYTYTVEAGAPREGFPPGTPWSEIPLAWCCPDCGVREKPDFAPLSRAVSLAV